MQYQIVLEINPEGAVIPFANRGLANRAETLVGLAEFAQHVVHADTAPGHHLGVHCRNVAWNNQLIAGARGLQDQTASQEDKIKSCAHAFRFS